METSILLLALILFISPSAAVTLPGIFKNAGDVLSHSGFLSMSLTLQIAFPSLMFNSSTSTVFAPSDGAFIKSGQPTLSLLQYHISPSRIDIDDLESLPFGSALPTLLADHSLFITAPAYEGQSSINNIKIGESPLYDDGDVIIYGVDEFFNFSFQIHQESPPTSTYPPPVPPPPPDEPAGRSDGVNSFIPVSDFLMTKGYTRIATFLSMQITGFSNPSGLTIFAPFDEAIDGAAKNFSDFSLIFRRHAVPEVFTLEHLTNLDAGTSLPTFSERFAINVTKSGENLLLNQLPVIFPNLYSEDWIVVHGINRLLSSPENQESKGDTSFDFDGDGGENPSEYGEY